jgi:hypothetical protein
LIYFKLLMTKSKFNNKNKMSIYEFRRSAMSSQGPALTGLRRQPAAVKVPVPSAPGSSIFKDTDFPVLTVNNVCVEGKPTYVQGAWAAGVGPVLYGLAHAPDPVYEPTVKQNNDEVYFNTIDDMVDEWNTL